MPRICVIVPGMPATEDEWFLPYLVDYLRRLHAHADLHVYALKHPGRSGTYSVHGIPITSFNQSWVRLQSALMNSVLADHAAQPFTHVHAVWANSAGFFGAMVARNLKLPFIVTLGGEELVALPAIKYGAMRKWRTRPILRYVFATADAIVAPSSESQTALMHRFGIPRAKIHPIWFGADTDSFYPGDEPTPPLHIVAAGGLIPVKQHRLLIEAFAIVKQHIPDARLTIAGEGPLRGSYEAMIRDRGLEGSVSLPGWLHHDRMPDLYRSAHIAVVTSYREEIPVALLEALVSGLHVVSVNTGIAYDLAEQGEFPLTISAPTPDAIAEDILAAWGDGRSVPREALSEESLRMISSSTTVERMLGVIEGLRQSAP